MADSYMLLLALYRMKSRKQLTLTTADSYMLLQWTTTLNKLR